jgi:hypothetical protein
MEVSEVDGLAIKEKSENVNENDIPPTLQGEGAISTQYRKFDRSQWNKIEKRYDDPITNTVLDAMCKLGNPNSNIKEFKKTLKFCGDEIYLSIRPALVKQGYVPDLLIEKIKKEKGKDKKKNKKAKDKPGKEEIIKKNILSSFTNCFEETLATFSDKKFNGTFGFRSQYAEIRVITLIYAVKFLLNKLVLIPSNSVIFLNEKLMPQCYELILGIKKTLHNINSIPGISNIIIGDLKFAYDKLIKCCDFKYSTVFEKYPRLCLVTAYDTIFRSMSIKPYISQEKLLHEIKNRNSVLCFYQAMIGSGKTTLSIALSEYVNSLRILRKANKEKSNLQLIFTCSVEPVRHQVCRMAYNQNIPFGIAVVDAGENRKFLDSDSVKIINNYNCSDDSKRLLIVTDLDATISLLNKSQDYILFIDEPTVGADEPNNPITKAVCKIMTIAPKITILCSATLPIPEEIPEIVTYFKKRHNNTNDNNSLPEIVSIYSKESLIGCEMINFDGTTICPHNDCSSCDELKIIIKNLKEKPFIDRLYTAPVVYKLRQKMLENGITDVIELENYFDHVDKLSQTNIQASAILFLEKLLEKNNDELVKKVCAPFGRIIIKEDDQEEIKKEEEENKEAIGFSWDDEIKNDNYVESLQYNLDEIFTSQAYKYLGGCLVTVSDPIKFAFEKSRTLLQDCETAAKIITKYKAELSRFNISLEKMNNMKHDNGKHLNEEDVDKLKQSIVDDRKPTIKFLSSLIINTPAHLMKFAPQMKDKINKKMLQFSFNLENIPLDMNVPDWVIQLLFAGVGIYAPGNHLLDNTYLDFVLNMTADGNLAFLISDDNICYGANYPFAHVVIDDIIASKHSIGTLFQLAGRAGRVGQSWVAYAHVGHGAHKRIMNYIKGNESIGVIEESINMRQTFNNIIEEINANKNTRSEPLIPTGSKKVVIVKLSEIQPIIEYKPIHQEEKNVESINDNNNSNVYVPPHKRQLSNDHHHHKDKDKWSH